MTDKDVETLNQYESFARLVQYLHDLRESAIGGLYNSADGREIDRTTGEIRALDNLLLRLDYKKVLKNWEHLM